MPVKMATLVTIGGLSLAGGLAACVAKSGEYHPWYSRLLGLGKPIYPISGKCEFPNVEEEFSKHFKHGLEVGASVAVYSRGRLVVELYGGYANYEQKQESIAVARLVGQGRLSYSDTIASIWPEFGGGGKKDVTVADLMRHEAGVAYLNEYTLQDFQERARLAELLEKHEYLHGGRSYHAMTRGYIINEIVSRVDPKGRTLGQIYKEDFNPALDIEFYLGLDPEKETRRSRWYSYPTFDQFVGKCFSDVPAPKENSPLTNVRKMFGMLGKDAENGSLFSTLEMPSCNGFTNSVALAKVGSAMANEGSVDGTSLVSEDSVIEALECPIEAFDSCLGQNTTMTKGGFGVFTFDELGPHIKFCGWPGMGGSVLLFHPESHFSFSYVMNAQHLDMLIGKKAQTLLVAAYKSHVASQ